jgi:N-acyl-phosphatidylethanolamine-hydrolysing phospholipase D
MTRSRRFRNPGGSLPQTAGFAEFVPFFFRRMRESSRRLVVPAGHVVPEAEAIQTFERLAGRDTITWLGHSSFLIRLAGRTILTDPYLSDFAGPLPGFGTRRFVPPGISVARLPRIDALLVSHNHYDHLDRRTLRALAGKEKTTAVVPLGLGAILRADGFPHVQELDWEDAISLDGLIITALPALHFSSRTPFDRNQTLWCSFAIAAGARRLFFSGDTGYGPVFERVGREHGPFDVAMVPIGAYEPESIMRPVHCDPEEAVRLGKQIGARTLAAMHWGTVVLTDEPPFEPPVQFRAAARAAGYADENVWVLRIGETRVLSP